MDNFIGRTCTYDDERSGRERRPKLPRELLKEKRSSNLNKNPNNTSKKGWSYSMLFI